MSGRFDALAVLGDWDDVLSAAAVEDDAVGDLLVGGVTTATGVNLGVWAACVRSRAANSLFLLATGAPVIAAAAAEIAAVVEGSWGRVEISRVVKIFS